MNLQAKVVETATDIRARAAALTEATIEIARGQAAANAERIALIKTSLSALRLAGRELNHVARRHVSRFVKQNSTIAREAGKEVSALARATYEQISKRDQAIAPKPAKAAARKRRVKRARSTRAA